RAGLKPGASGATWLRSALGSPGMAWPKCERGRAHATFGCNVCLETAREDVVSACGHLCCWPCLHQWLETWPVCTAGISREFVQLYGRGSQKPQDPRLKTAPGPQGQGPTPESRGDSRHLVTRQEGRVSPLVWRWCFSLWLFHLSSMLMTFSQGCRCGSGTGRVAWPPDGRIPLLFLTIFFFWLLGI
uniref:E3 ubiquitin-protein ligase RNF n=1 Tax=Sciurus vulgaris TaxID=55149 RepID=A0A8D2CT53_SCIVU